MKPKVGQDGPKMGLHRSTMDPRKLQEYLAGFDFRAARLLGRAPRARAHTYAYTGRRPEMAQDAPKVGRRWLRDALTNSRGGGVRPSRGILGTLLGPSWAVLGLPWPFLGGPRGHLEANLGLRRAVVGMRYG